jgi:TPR repeat protein
MDLHAGRSERSRRLPDRRAAQPETPSERFARVELAVGEAGAEVEAALARGDYSRAMPLLESLAAQGNPVAQFKLGSLHSLGQGMPVDQQQAATWFEQASQAGHHEATVTLANMYLSGLGVPRDESRAMELFERAAKIAEQQEIEDEDCD